MLINTISENLYRPCDAIKRMTGFYNCGLRLGARWTILLGDIFFHSDKLNVNENIIELKFKFVMFNVQEAKFRILLLVLISCFICYYFLDELFCYRCVMFNNISYSQSISKSIEKLWFGEVRS